MKHIRFVMLRRAGFSLMEMLIAVAILAFLGTIVLQVFLSSNEMNRQAQALDRAVSLSVDAVERLKAINPSEPLNRQTLSGWFPEGTFTSVGEGFQLTFLFDESFQPFSSEDSSWPKGAMSVLLQPDPQTGGSSSLASVTVRQFANQQTDSWVLQNLEELPDKLRESTFGDVIFTLQAAVPSACVVEEVLAE